jgi:phage tail sheath protein FI
MASQFSTPGVYRREIDLSQGTVPAGTSIGAIVGGAKKGPANARISVGNQRELLDTFGKPVADWSADYGIYGALQYLNESGNLFYFRATDGTEAYSNLIIPVLGTSAGTSALTDNNISAFDFFTTSVLANHTSAYSEVNTPTYILDIENVNGTAGANTSAADNFVVASIGPGSYGENVAIKITTSATGYSAVDWSKRYDATPTSASGLWTEVFKLEVFVKSETSVSFPSIPEEIFYGTLGDRIAPDGTQLNIAQVVNGKSSYVYVKSNASVGSIPLQITTAKALANGADSAAQLPESAISTGWSMFNDKNNVTVTILIGTFVSSTIATAMNNVAASRLDCITTAQVGSEATKVVASLITESDAMSFAAPSYTAKYVGWSQIYDSYNDKKKFIPNSIFGAVLMARTDRVAETWLAPAGANRGILPVLDQNKKFTDTEIGQLYDANMNAVRFIRGQGFVMWGQKTAQTLATALREIAVRRLFLFLENTIEPSLVPFVFEPNNASTRLRAFEVVDNFMATIKAAGGVEQYAVVNDETNNTPQVIDSQMMNVDVIVTPPRTTEVIRLNMVVTKSGVNVAEVTV